MLLEGDLTYDITVRYLGMPAKGADLDSEVARAIAEPRCAAPSTTDAGTTYYRRL